jgi:hypothetical protein
VIAALTLTTTDYDRLIHSPYLDELVAGEQRVSVLVVHGDATAITAPGSAPVVVCWVGDSFGGSGPANADLVVAADEVDAVVAMIEAAPRAATALALLLRTLPDVETEHGLALESATYSLLQAGPEFAAWRAAHEPRPCPDDRPTVRAERTDDVLRVTLDRPARHNAISTRLRDDLCEALAIAVSDDTIAEVRLAGAGPSFCSGGDLDEFGSRRDPVDAHITRLARSPARLLHRLAGRTTAEIHGATLGGGIEMAAFCSRLVADPDTVIGLPEIELGLIPGAGGTVSLTRRIGRQRTAALALTSRRIDATTALAWGLVDAIN